MGEGQKEFKDIPKNDWTTYTETDAMIFAISYDIDESNWES